MISEAPAPLNWTIFLTLFGKKLVAMSITCSLKSRDMHASFILWLVRSGYMVVVYVTGETFFALYMAAHLQ